MNCLETGASLARRIEARKSLKGERSDGGLKQVEGGRKGRRRGLRFAQARVLQQLKEPLREAYIF